MLSNELIKILRCPEDHSALTPASEAVVARVNAAIRDGRAVNCGGKRLDTPVEDGFVRADGKRFYPIIGGIPILLRDEAIELDRLAT